MEPVTFAIFNIDKPAGISSAAVVARLKRLLPRGTKVGHAGTLDPFATGVLLVLAGRATKWCEKLMGEKKGYLATIKFGATTATDDPESPEENVYTGSPVEQAVVESAILRWVGVVQQRPPIFSAMKVGGHRAYKLARAGKAVALQPREVRIDAIELVNYSWPEAQVRIGCGRGTYIRAIARDVGADLGTGAHLTQLRRTFVGRFTIDKATPLDSIDASVLEQLVHSSDIPAGESPA